jgi:hypothetical protein
MTLARTVHEDAGSPSDCSIHHAITPAGQNLLYFSPECASVFGDLLKLSGATLCDKPPEVGSLMQVLQWPRQTKARNSPSSAAP